MKKSGKTYRSRDLNQLLQTAKILTFSSIKRLLFSKTTIGLILLCLIPILVFSLWVGGVFPQETEDLYEKEIVNYKNVYESQVVELQKNFGDLSLVKDDLNMSVDITEVQFQPAESSNAGAVGGSENLQTIYLRGTTIGNVSFLNLSISFHVFDFSFPFNLSIVGPVENELIRFTGLGAAGPNYWQDWEFELKNVTIPILDLSQLQGFGINLEDFTGDETPIRLVVLVQAIDNSSINDDKIIWNFDHKEIYVEIDESGVSDYGIVGKDIKKKTIETTSYDVFNTVAPQLYFIVIIPLITILYSISVVREDIDTHNIVYLISRPISRAEILLLKFKGFFISTWLLISISMIISFIIIALSEPDKSIQLDSLINLLLISTLNIVVYGALFFVFTLITSYPIILSLLFVFVWENIISSLPSVLNRISISYWVKGLGYRLLPDVGITNVYLPLSVFESTAVLIISAIVFLIIGIFLFYNKEFS
jgi:ABC-type transport system involved in multi-copper enzyme maturation permease subunit